MSTLSATSPSLVLGSLRQLTTIGVVAGIGSTYASFMIGASDMLAVQAAANGGSVGAAFTVVAAVFIGIALFVSAIVIGNAVDTVVAAQRRQLTTLRLLGASGRQLRSALVRGVCIVAGGSAIAGLLVGIGAADLTRIILVHRHTLKAVDYHSFPPGAVVATLVVTATAAVATMMSTRATLAGSSVTASRAPHTASRGRIVSAVVFVGIGTLLLIAACLLGERGTPAAFFLAFLGAVSVSVSILLAAVRIVPRLVTATGRLMGRGSCALVARTNAVADPARTTRATIGLLIGVTLVTSIVCGMSSLTTASRTWNSTDPAQAESVAHMMSLTTAILVAVISVSSLIAAVGFVSTMMSTVIARTREIGMLRALGYTRRQVRTMIVLECAALTGTAVAAGLVLGVLFGAVGAHSLIGSQVNSLTVGVPVTALLVVVAAACALVLVAAMPPSRYAARITPVEALAREV